MHWIVHLDGGPRRVNHAAVAVGEYIYSFGGYCTERSYQTTGPMDVHKLNTNNFRWSLISIDVDENWEENVPYQRYGHTAVAYGDKIYVWGGRNNTSACNILYIFDTIECKWSAPKVSGIIPGERDGHSACIIDHVMYIFGGFVEEVAMFSQDVHGFDLRTNQWNFFYTRGSPPSYRDFHSATALDRRMYIFGGRGDRNAPFHSQQEVYCEKMMYLDVDTGMWHEPRVIGKVPIGRRSHSTFIHNNKFYIFGGYNGLLDDHFNDMYCYCPTNNEWKTVQIYGKGPCKRRRQACVMIKDRLFLFGGTSPFSPAQLQQLRAIHEDFLDDAKLMDHGDLHVMDFVPNLQTLCIWVVMQNRLEQKNLPPMIRWEINAMTTPNTISRPETKTG